MLQKTNANGEIYKDVKYSRIQSNSIKIRVVLQHGKQTTSSSLKIGQSNVMLKITSVCFDEFLSSYTS